MEKDFKYTNLVLALPLFFVLFLWFVFWLEVRFDYDFAENGIFPRTFSGLQGVLFSPFIHEDISHLYGNSIPLLILLAALQYFYSRQSFYVLAIGILFSGIITWAIGRANYHIGASSVIYVLVSFIFLKGILTKYYRLVALSLSVVLFYGGLIWYVFPEVDELISWEGHLGGLVAGTILALFLKTPEYEKVAIYDWEKPDYNVEEDRFMQHFDENGNFITTPEEVLEAEFSPYFTSSFPVHYTISNESDK